MRTSWLTAFVALGLAAAAPGLAAEQQPVEAKKHATTALSCGLATATAETTMVIVPFTKVIWVDQTISIQSSAFGKTFVLPKVRPVVIDKEKTLPSRVVSWACLDGKAGKYILLSYACGRDDLRGLCDGEREWFRILNENGKRMDGGYRPQDPRYKALYARLGIADAVNGSTQMKDVTDNGSTDR